MVMAGTQQGHGVFINCNGEVFYETEKTLEFTA